MSYTIKEIKQGIKLHLIETEKFKTNLMTVVLTLPLKRDTVTLNSVIPAVLKRGTEKLKSQEEISKTLGKSRSSIANTLRILNLDERVQEMIEMGQISEGHARSIASISSPDKQYKFALDIINFDMNVRDAENYAKDVKSGKKPKKTTKTNLFYN